MSAQPETQAKMERLWRLLAQPHAPRGESGQVGDGHKPWTCPATNKTPTRTRATPIAAQPRPKPRKPQRPWSAWSKFDQLGEILRPLYIDLQSAG